MFTIPAHMIPDTEKSLSLGTDEEGIVRRSRATSASIVEQRHLTLAQ